MADKLKQLLQKVIDWWNKFSARQKTIIIVVATVVLIAIAGIVSFLTRDQYVHLMTCEDTTEASAVKDLLEEEGLTYKVSTDGLTFQILTTQQSDANLILGANSIPTATYSIDNVTSGGFSTTESDKQKRYVLYLESRLENDFIEKFSAIKHASVELSIPDNTGTLIDSKEESHASILLDIDGEFTQDNAAFLARAVATAIGNTTTNNIVILDTDGNMLFSGDDNYTATGAANAQLTVKKQAEAQIKGEVKSVLLGTNEFDSVEVACNLDIDFSNSTIVDHQYTPAEGQTQGVLSHEDIYNAENTSGVGGVPGTDTNTENDTTYMIEDTSNSSSSVTEESRDYLPNERITTTESGAGTINYDNSSISATLINYNVIKEEDVETQGLLDGITWDEYKLANSERTKLEIDEDLFDVVSKATGIAVSNIAIMAYSENVFFDKEGPNVKITDIIQIALVILILALLAFVVLRSMQGEKIEEEPEEELSIESLLQTNPESELEDISMEEESEIKKLISRFVEENPESAAQLLRNWLNEEWG